MLALHGFDVYGLEVSETGAEAAREYATSQIAEPNEYNFGSKDYLPTEGCGKIQIVAGDFFRRDWEPACADGDATKFDVIYDYTIKILLIMIFDVSFHVLTTLALLVSLRFTARNAPRLGESNESAFRANRCTYLS